MFILKAIRYILEQLVFLAEAVVTVWLKAPICFISTVIYCYENKASFDYCWAEVCYNMLVGRLHYAVPLTMKLIRYTKYMYRTTNEYD